MKTALVTGVYRVSYRPVRPIPQSDSFFENIWAEYRKNENVY